MKFAFLITLVLVLSRPTMTAGAADLKDFSKEDIEAFWPELWKSLPNVKTPTVDPLTQGQVISQMTGNWNTWNGEERELLFLGTNGQVTVSGIHSGKKWQRHGEWKVMSNKVVLFLPDVVIPGFIFRTEGKLWIFNPGVDTLKSEMLRPTAAANQSTNNAPQPVLAVDGKISKAIVLDILHSLDDEQLDKNAAAVVALFASNAVLTATVVEGQRSDTSTNTPDNRRSDMETTFKDVDDDKLQRKNVLVQIAPNGWKATSLSTIVESYELRGSAHQSTESESATFEVIDGKVLITQMDSKITIK